MHREPLATLEMMLAPETLTRVSREPIDSVRHAPFTGGHSASGSTFLSVETNDGRGPRFIVKRSSPTSDWIVRATADELGREVLVWTSGLLDRLPSEIVHPVIACACDEGGWAILMRDVSDVLIPDPMGTSPISRADHRRYIDALAALHVAFWNEKVMIDPALGYCSPAHLYTALSPETGRREIDHPNDVVSWLREGWDVFWTLVEPDVGALLRQLFQDPEPLCAALARFPQTLVHGDPRAANIGIVREPTPRVVLIDWHFVGLSTPGVDISWYLWSCGSRHPVARETTIAWYRDRLAHRLGSDFDETWWRPQLELSLLGQLMRGGWGSAWDAVHDPSATVRAWNREDLVWWSERARAGARWL
jgi:hypothetical protein